MRTSREKAGRSRQRILDAASKLFREKGIAAVGVDAVMKDAGFTHGGFYGHFRSKGTLAAEAVDHAMRDNIDAHRAHESLEALAAAYLTPAHRDQPRDGCSLVALGAEVSRFDRKVHRQVAANLDRHFAVIEELFRARGAADPRGRAITTLSTLAGALLLSRMAGKTALSNEILESVRSAVAAGSQT